MTSKWHTTFSRSFVFLTRIHRIMNKMTDAISDTLTPPSNPSHSRCRDLHILVIYRDRFCCFRFFSFFFSVKSDLNAYSLDTVQDFTNNHKFEIRTIDYTIF